LPVADEGRIVEERISRGTFIRLGTALGVSAAGASVLAACGGSGSESGGGSGSRGSGNGGSSGGEAGNGSGSSGGSGGNAGGSKKTQASGGKAIARASEVAPGSAVKFKDSGQSAVLIHLQGGDFVAYSAVCTHQGCTVAYKNGELACPCHGSVFDPANGGAVVNGPAQRPLPELPIKVRGGEVVRV
jgi:Rieske Fe-S protein